MTVIFVKRIGFMLPNFPYSRFQSSFPTLGQKMVLFALIVMIMLHAEAKHVCLSGRCRIKENCTYLFTKEQISSVCSEVDA